MLACCLALFAAIVAVTLFGIQLNAILTLAFVLLCPLKMIMMMGGHGNAPLSPDLNETTPSGRALLPHRSWPRGVTSVTIRRSFRNVATVA